MPKRQTAKRRAVKQSKKRLIISYPLILFLLLCAGVYLVVWTLRASADDIQVTAAIQGPPVTGAPVITAPAAGSRFTAVPITVTGTCPANAAYVEVFRNSVMSGSAICSGGGTFQLQIDLFAGRNDLTAQGFNVNDDPGPISATVTVFYDLPSAAQPGQSAGTGGSNSGGQSNISANPLLLKTSFIYKGYFTGQQVSWPLEVEGGNPPYALNVDWGDGSNSVISRKEAGDFNINHTYKKPGGYKGSYRIIVQASDTTNNYSYLQIFVIVTDKTVNNIGSIYSKPPPTLGGFRHWLWIAWPVYTLILLMAITFRLGEREELIILKKRGLLKRV